MKCSNCDSILPDDAKFCTHCGTTTEQMKKASILKKKLIPFAQQFKKTAYKLWNKLSFYSKISTIAIVVFTIMCLIAFFTGKIFSGIIATVSIVLTTVALLIKNEVIKSQKNRLHICLLTLSVVLTIPYFNVLNIKYPNLDVDMDTIVNHSPSNNKSDNMENAEHEISIKESNDITNNEHKTTDYNIDYFNAESFEQALNNGVNVEGKIVQFDVVEYKPDSALGINCWSGEHLNFISKEPLDLEQWHIKL